MAIQAFEDVKQALCQELVLYTPDFQKSFYLQMDALGTSLGAILFKKEQGEESPIACKKLSTAETWYSTIEWEYLATQWGVELF